MLVGLRAIDLTLIKPTSHHVPYVNFPKVGVCQISLKEISSVENCFAERGSIKMRLNEDCSSQFRLIKVCIFQVSFGKDGIVEMSFKEGRITRQVSMLKIGLT